MVLMATAGMTNKAITEVLGTDQNKVCRWRRRFAELGLEGISKERPRGDNHGGQCSKAQAQLRSVYTAELDHSFPSMDSTFAF